MPPHAAKQTSIVLGTAGVLFILAGTFHLIGMSYALFFGVACFIFAGMVKNSGRTN
jgi:hypothetical protein